MIKKRITESIILPYTKLIRILNYIGIAFLLLSLLLKLKVLLKIDKFTFPTFFALQWNKTNLFHFFSEASILLFLSMPLIGLFYLFLRLVREKNFTYAFLSFLLILYIILTIIISQEAI